MVSVTSIGSAFGRPPGTVPREAAAKVERALQTWARAKGASPLTIPAADPNGFDVTLFSDTHGVRACFGGLEQEFDTIDQAAAWVGRALSDAYRLKIEYLGDRPWRWTLEQVAAPGDASKSLASGRPALWSFLRKKRVVYRQNTGLSQLANWPLTIAGALAMASMGLGSPADTARADVRDAPGAAAMDAAAAKDRAAALVIEGVAQARRGNVDDAIRLFSLGIRTYPKLAAAYANRGVALFRKDQNRDAAADFSSAIALNAEDYRSLSYRGLAHAKLGSHASALEDFARALELAPRFPVPYGGQALVFVAQGRFGEAVTSCNRAIELGLRDADIYKTRSVAHLGLGERDKAAADMSLAEAAASAR